MKNILSKFMEKMMSIHGEDKLRRHYNNNTLDRLSGIGKVTKNRIIEHFEKEIPKKHNILELIEREFQGNITDELIDKIENSLKNPNNIVDIFEQIRTVNSSKNIKCRLFLYLTILPINSEYIKKKIYNFKGYNK